MSKESTLAKINKLAEKRKSLKQKKDTLTIEDSVMEFFHQIDDARAFHNGKSYSPSLWHAASQYLKTKLSLISPGSSFNVEWQSTEEQREHRDYEWTTDIVRGITVNVTSSYAKANNLPESFYIDVSEQLFR